MGLELKDLCSLRFHHLSWTRHTGLTWTRRSLRSACNGVGWRYGLEQRNSSHSSIAFWMISLHQQAILALSEGQIGLKRFVLGLAAGRSCFASSKLCNYAWTRWPWVR